MKKSNLNILSSIDSFDEYEKLKPKTEIWEGIAQEIVNRHQLPHASLTLFSEGTNIAI